MTLLVAVLLAAWQPASQQGTGQRIELIHELTIGADAAEPEYEFAAMGPVAVARSGTVFVVAYDGTVAQLRRYDRDGRYRGAIGQSGAGPGEYGMVTGLALIGDTLLVVLDGGHRRLVLFDTAGAYRRAFAVAGGAGLEHGFTAFADGSVGIRVMAPAPGASRQQPMPTALVRYQLDGQVLDTMPLPSMRPGAIELRARVGRRTAFAAESVFTLLPDRGMASGYNTAYRIRVTPRSGGAPHTIERPDRPLPLEGRERDEWQSMLELARSRGFPIDLPRRKPLIRDLLADEDGRLWVEVYTTAAYREPAPRRPGSPARPQLTMWEHNAYDVFGPDGRYLGRVDLKPFSRLHAVRGERLWVSEETDDGGYALVRYRLRMP